MDLPTILSLIGVATSLFAIIGLWIEIRSSRLALKTETALHLEDQFYSPEMVKTRQIAAKKLLEGNPYNHELSDVLDHFARITLLVKRKAIDRQLAYDLQEYWFVRYWLVSKEYVAAAREYDPYSWSAYENLVKYMMKKNPQEYSPQMLKQFLLEEARYDGEPLETPKTIEDS
ncbi:MAG: hypothetical protein JW757_01130 [Anaerolineales bacterium]|nr:hypothetical protein [Anaerolineales bacterium]